MCDFDEDFDDGDSFENEFNDEFMDDTDDGFSTDDSESDDSDADEFTVRDAFLVGSIVGNAYEEGLDERERRRLLRKKRSKRGLDSD